MRYGGVDWIFVALGKVKMAAAVSMLITFGFI
jgi:hypothetical protein